MTEQPTSPEPTTTDEATEAPATTDAPTAQRPGQSWSDRMAAEEPTAREQWTPGDVYEPHDGETSDANLFYTDLMSGPQPEFDPTLTPLHTEQAPAQAPEQAEQGTIE
jgi:hypothetical protein